MVGLTRSSPSQFTVSDLCEELEGQQGMRLTGISAIFGGTLRNFKKINGTAAGFHLEQQIGLADIGENKHGFRGKS